MRAWHFAVYIRIHDAFELIERYFCFINSVSSVHCIESLDRQRINPDKIQRVPIVSHNLNFDAQVVIKMSCMLMCH